MHVGVPFGRGDHDVGLAVAGDVDIAMFHRHPM
jgi:hypothetical protein